MAITVDVQGNMGNQYIADTGTAGSNATVIYSGFTSGTVDYNIRLKTQAAGDVMGVSDMTISSAGSTSELVQSVSSSALAIVLPFRTDLQVRVRRNSGAWSGWYDFKTRDKTYELPDAMIDLRTTQADTSSGATVVVTNVGKSQITNTSRGATVVNADKDGTEITINRASSTGQYIKCKTTVVNTAHGAMVTKLS